MIRVRRNPHSQQKKQGSVKLFYAHRVSIAFQIALKSPPGKLISLVVEEAFCSFEYE